MKPRYLEVLVFWEQGLDMSGTMDNSTCGTGADISVNCVDNSEAPSDPLFPTIENNYHHKGEDRELNIKIYNPNGVFQKDWSKDPVPETFTMTMRDINGDAVPLKNVTSGFCDITEHGVGQFSCVLHDYAVRNLVISVNAIIDGASDQVSNFKSEITAS